MENKDNVLEVLIGNLPEHKITGADGNEYVFTRIDLFDIQELIGRYGSISLGEMKNKAKDKTTDQVIMEAIDYYLYVAWLGIRKRGLTDAQLEKNEWKMNIKKMARILPNNIPFLRALADKIFEMSGYGMPVESKKTGLDEEEKNSSAGGTTPPAQIK